MKKFLNILPLAFTIFLIELVASGVEEESRWGDRSFEGYTLQEPCRIQWSDVPDHTTVCPICLDSFDEEELIVTTQCKLHNKIALFHQSPSSELEDEILAIICDNQILGHFFHSNCINAWLNDHATCPLCKQIIKNTASELATENQNQQVESGSLRDRISSRCIGRTATNILCGFGVAIFLKKLVNSL